MENMSILERYVTIVNLSWSTKEGDVVYTFKELDRALYEVMGNNDTPRSYDIVWRECDRRIRALIAPFLETLGPAFALTVLMKQWTKMFVLDRVIVRIANEYGKDVGRRVRTWELV